MAYYDTYNNDEQIELLMRFLFEYQAQVYKQEQHQHVVAVFQELELASKYQLFALVRERLPNRAKHLFSAEDFSGKQHVILKVMHHLTQ